MYMYLLNEIIKGENRDIILETIDYANKQWKYILETNNYSEIKHLERELERKVGHRTLGKCLVFYTGITQFYNDGFYDCNKEELRLVLNNMYGICIEIDRMIDKFREDYNI